MMLRVLGQMFKLVEVPIRTDIYFHSLFFHYFLATAKFSAVSPATSYAVDSESCKWHFHSF